MRMQNLRSPNEQVQNGNLNQREREFTFGNFNLIFSNILPKFNFTKSQLSIHRKIGYISK